MHEHEISSKNHAEQFARKLVFTHLKAKAFGAEALNIGFRAPFLFCEKWICRHIPRQAKILDFGCGSGSCMVYFSRKGYSMTGFDISPQALHLGKELSEKLQLTDKFRVFLSSGETIPLKDESIDLVFSSAVLSFVDLNKAMTEIVRVLKPSGTLVILDTLGHNPLLNFKRYLNLKKGTRTSWSVRHILKQEDIYKIRGFFNNGTCRYFDLFVLHFALLAMPLRSKFSRLERLLSPFVFIARAIDTMILAVPLFRKFSFKFVCILSQPKKREINAG